MAVIPSGRRRPLLMFGIATVGGGSGQTRGRAPVGDDSICGPAAGGTARAAPAADVGTGRDPRAPAPELVLEVPERCIDKAVTPPPIAITTATLPAIAQATRRRDRRAARTEAMMRSAFGRSPSPSRSAA